MATYIIGYDIHPPKGETYEELYKAIKLLGAWWHHLDSTWLVISDLSAKEIRDTLIQQLRDDDQLLVTKSSGVGAWHGFNDSGSKWLKDHL